MGAASSLHSIYSDATYWFQTYMDKETYMACYDEMDVNKDGGIDFIEFKSWISAKSKKKRDSMWHEAEQCGSAIMMAHKLACMQFGASSSGVAKRCVDISDMRALFIHLYAVCIIWKHFTKANSDDPDLYKKKITQDEFNADLAVLCEMRSKEELTPTQLMEDFFTLDNNYVGKIGFVQVCVVFGGPYIVLIS